MIGRGLRFVINRLWWGRFHWLVRFGWMNLKGRAVGDARLGLGLIAVGFILQRRKKKRHLRTRAFKLHPPQSTSISVRRLHS